ncbi:MAG TPA: type II toxin-antitoxin system prevent-host-death family antitoxin, partial [Gammaproteobacteria bacterium]|nr:type II toxin-antitoxin system prevent-host-death family antitoxin [Gammaproteobacteria bacterium]
RAAEMLDEIKATRRVIVLTQNGAASAVVQNYESFQRLQESLAMLKLMIRGEADIRANRTTPRSKVFSSLRAELERKDG